MADIRGTSVDGTLSELAARIEAQERELTTLRTQLGRLQREHATGPAAPDRAVAAPTPGDAPSRRALLQRGGLLAGGVVAASGLVALARPGVARADNGGNFILGNNDNVTNDATLVTRLVKKSNNANFQNGFEVENADDFGAAIVAQSDGASATGVFVVQAVTGTFNGHIGLHAKAGTGGTAPAAPAGIGVLGQAVQSGGTGVHGEGHTAGVFGQSTNGNGVFGQGASSQAGTWGVSTSGPGTGGNSTSGFGIYGVSLGNDGVRGFSTSGFGLHGISSNSNGVYGEGGGANAGVAGIGTSGPGVYGQSGSGTAVFATSTSGTGVYGTSSSGLAGWFVGPVQVNGSFTVVGGPKSAAVPHPDGSHRRLYCVESPESFFEDFGRDRLANGRGRVRLDPDFAAVVHSDNYDVVLTAEGDTKGLFVSNKTPQGFEVQENQGGTSSVAFSYRVVARRKDIAGPRLERVAVVRDAPPLPARAQRAADDAPPIPTPPGSSQPRPGR